MATMWASSRVFVNGLSWLSSKVNRMTICNANPSNVAQAIGSSSTKFRAGTSGATVGAAGTTTIGYVIKVTSAASLAVTSSGVAACVVLCAGTSHLAYITKCTTRGLTTADTIRIPAWRIRIADPTSS